MTRQEWETIGRERALRERRATWELAHWLVAGREWDRDFAVSAEITGYSRSHLWNLYRVGVAFPEGKAHPDLSFTVHRELLRARDEATRLIVLSSAIEGRWTAEDVIAHFERHPQQTRPMARPDFAVVKPTKTERSRRAYVGTHVGCPACGHVFPVRGHKHEPAAPGGSTHVVVAEVDA